MFILADCSAACALVFHFVAFFFCVNEAKFVLTSCIINVIFRDLYFIVILSARVQCLDSYINERFYLFYLK